jgi:zinc transport system substrate-binding protein
MRYWRTMCLTLAGILLVVMSVGVAAAEPIQVFVSISPQRHFVERIGGEGVAVSVMVPPGAGPVSYEPKPRQMTALSGSAIYFAVGVPFEAAWLPRFSDANPDLTIVHTQDGIEKVPMRGHHHGDDPEHGHDDPADGRILDPHVWLSPPLVILQARNILDALCSADPNRRAGYEANYREFIGELVDLDLAIREIFSDVERGSRFMVFHPSWGYFARAYGLEQIPAEVEGKDPKPAELQRLIDHARTHKIRIIFVQPQFSDKSARVIASAIDGRVAVADPLSPDWADNLRRVAQSIRDAIKGSAG